MKVIIYVEDLKLRKLIQKELVKYSYFNLPSLEIVLCVCNSEEVLHYLNQFDANCYILDLDNDIKGLELANSIRKKDVLGDIIFLTENDDNYKLNFKYKIAALDYILTSLSKKEFIKNLLETLEVAYYRYIELGNTSYVNLLQIKIGEKIKNIKYEDIYYFETSEKSHKLKIHYKNGSHEFYGKLKELENLDQRFYRCHNSYLININFVHYYNYNKGMVRMANGHECLVSNRYKRKIMEFKI